MTYNREKLIYYISDVNNGLLYVVDGKTYHIIKKIKIGQRPQNIAVDNIKNLYIASDRSKRITVINNLSSVYKIFYAPNNGNIRVDYNGKKIYVSNGYEICVYDLITGKKIKVISGFTAADGLELDDYDNRLFVLDVLQKNIKVYDTKSFNLIKIYKDSRILPKFMFFDKNRKNLYIANNKLNRNNKNENIGYIFILNTEDDIISEISLDEGSLVTALDSTEKLLYAVNIGLGRIEVVDILEKRSVCFIKTTLSEIQKIKLSPNNDILVATSKNKEGKGVIDIINLDNNKIIKTINLGERNSNPRDIAIVSKNILSLKPNKKVLNKYDKSINKSKVITTLIKKVLWSHEEKIIFNNVSVKVNLDDINSAKIELVRFGKCKSEDIFRNIVSLNNISEYYLLNYNFYIPFSIICMDDKNRRSIIEGKLEGVQSMKFYMSDFEKYKDMDFVIKSSTNLEGSPKITGDIISFDASSIISDMIVVEEIKNVYVYEDRNG